MCLFRLCIDIMLLVVKYLGITQMQTCCVNSGMTLRKLSLIFFDCSYNHVFWKDIIFYVNGKLEINILFILETVFVFVIFVLFPTLILDISKCSSL